MDKNEAYAYLRIVEFPCTVAELTQRIGLQPTEAWHAGDAALLPRPPRKFNVWHLRSRLPTSEDVERHIIDVLDQVRGREAVLREVARDYGITMECVGHFHEYYPGFALDAETVRRLGECGASIDLDFYHYFTEKQEREA
ncbi:MAG: DUF4279 domain-containing protein [Verrucomicrobia bacterium]|nr:DUF4279 domain-containing protein [Verrucomicrobiota bacterium]